MDKKTILIWLLSLSLFAFSLPMMLRQEAPEVALPRLKIRSDARIEGLFYKKIEANKTVLELWAKEATFFRKKHLLEARAPRLYLYAKEETSTKGAKKNHRPSAGAKVEVTALRGKLDLKSMKTFFWGNALLKTPDNTTLYTEHLIYDPKNHTLKSDVPVIIKRGGLEITGSSLAYNVMTGKLTILKSTTNIRQ